MQDAVRLIELDCDHPASMTITCSKEEADGLVALLDHAVRHGGLGVAQAAVFWHQKLATAQASPPSARAIGPRERTEDNGALSATGVASGRGPQPEDGQ